MPVNIHHLHQFDDYHYEPSDHDNYPSHYHVWTGNRTFATIYVDIDDRHADDYQLTVGADHDHNGCDIRWADNHQRPTPGTTPAA